MQSPPRPDAASTPRPHLAEAHGRAGLAVGIPHAVGRLRPDEALDQSLHGACVCKGRGGGIWGAAMKRRCLTRACRKGWAAEAGQHSVARHIVPALRTRALEHGEDLVDAAPRVPVAEPGREGKALVALQRRAGGVGGAAGSAAAEG